MDRYYDREIHPQIARRLKAFLSAQDLREVHRRRAWRHFLVVAQQSILLVGIGLLCYRFGTAWVWAPLGLLQGFVILSFIILLHEQVHGVIFEQRRPVAERVLGLFYALPSGISASQFRRWHLDHHRELGTPEDPKRTYLSPKRISRWYKALYMTMGLFVIYSIAARKASGDYPGMLRRTIAVERIVSITLHIAFAVWLWNTGGAGLWFRVHGFPLVVCFPFAFTLNRLGQHYMIDPNDPAKWSTLVRSHPFWDWIFLWSNLHLEHHYLVGVPFYNLARLQGKLWPFFDSIGYRPLGYGEILYYWFVKNATPHANWFVGGDAGTTPNATPGG